MHLLKPLWKSGGSYHLTLPMSWLKYLKSKFGIMPKEVTITEVDDDLLVKAVKPDKEKE